MQRESFALTLYDYKETLQWVRLIGWTDDELRQVPVHEQASSGDDYINLTNFGGTPLGVSAKSGGGSSAGANVRGIHNLYVYRHEVPDHLWKRLQKLSDRGGPSAFEQDGQFGERGEASDFPPRAGRL
ncbi:MAG: hypothetical protein ACUVX1_17215 [Chloroflexota bacterium]|mgnify:CR=1 FL=1